MSFGRLHFLALVLCLGSLGQAHAASTRRPDCGAFDPDCSQRILGFINGIFIAPIRISAAEQFGSAPTQTVLRLQSSLLHADILAGDPDLILIDAAWDPNRGGYEVRASLLDAEYLFFCKDESQGLRLPGVESRRPPFAGVMGNCAPASFGMSLRALDYRRDQQGSQTRWIGTGLVYNPLHNGNAPGFINHNLLLSAGADLVTEQSSEWSDHDERETLVRAHFGFIGMIRARNNHWEVRALAGYRPNVSDFSDWRFEARAEYLYHLFFEKKREAGTQFVRTIGIQGTYTQWHRSNEGSDRAARLGLVFGFPGVSLLNGK